MKNACSFLFFLMAIKAIAQQTNYSDVAVIVNNNSQSSIDIANYFQAARNIPEQNMIHINAPTTEEIDSLQFEQIRFQIENYLTSLNLQDSINYLVTTKGLPLKVESGCFSPGVNGQACASFDSELCLILGPHSNQIGLSGSFVNPIYNDAEHFTKLSKGIYLVTRLDAYTKEDVYSLIDRSAPQTGLNQLSAQAILDLNAATGADSTYFINNYLQPTHDFLTNNSWNSQLDANVNPLLNQDNVFAYIYEGMGPLSHVNLNYQWTEGSIASMSLCSTAKTFDYNLNPNNDFLLGNLLAQGCTGAHGNVDCIYFSQILNTSVLMSRYLDQNEHFNLAESFYMAQCCLSWQGVVVGDPKSSVIVDNVASLEQWNQDQSNIFPNPSSGELHIQTNEEISSISIFDLKGALVKSLADLNSTSESLNLSELQAGLYILQIQVGDHLLHHRVLIKK